MWLAYEIAQTCHRKRNLFSTVVSIHIGGKKSPMDFSYSAEQIAFRDELRDWLHRNVPDAWRNDGPELPDDSDERWQMQLDWHQTLHEGNWVGIHWPEQYGGRGASIAEQVVFDEEMARWETPSPVNGIGIGWVGPTLVAAGTDEQKERFLPHILNANEIWCQGYSEPGAGSDIASLTTEVEKVDDQWVINGQKIWTSNAHRADWCFLIARSDFSGTKHEGITCLLVPMDQDGIQMEQIHQANDQRGFNQWFLDDAVTDESMVVGEPGNGWEVVTTMSAFERTNLSSIFSTEQAFVDIFEYCQTETRNGFPLIEDPSIRRTLADFDARIQAQKKTYFRNVSKRSHTGMPGVESSMENLVDDEIRVDLFDFAVNILGPDASLWEDSHREGEWMNSKIWAIGMWIGAGTGDLQRNIIGERVLGLPKDIKSDTSHRD